MKVVVIGGSGLVGSRIVDAIEAAGHTALPASPKTGVDTLTGAGLAEALAGTDVTIDAVNAPGSADPVRFFVESTRNLLDAGARARVRHHVVVSVVGADRLDTPYFRGKVEQEELVRAGTRPFSIVRSTQFLEFLGTIADAATADGVVRLPPIMIQPIPVADAARAVARIALGPPLGAMTEISGPTRYRLDERVASALAERRDPRRVVTDPDARYFGARVGERSLLPSASA